MGRQKDREEFVAIMAAEGVGLDLARYLMRQATTLHRLAEASCNGDGHDHPEGPRHWVKPDGSGTWCAVVLEPGIRRTGRRPFVTCPDCLSAEREADVVRVLQAAGGKLEPVFRGDPRGAVLKLKVPSGRTNDWGRTGVCVP